MTVLYIDDDKDDCELFCEAVAALNKGIVCLSTTSAKKSIELVHEKCPDYIFLDYRMPLLNGRETIEKLRLTSCFQHTRVIMISSYMSDSEIIECRNLGAIECLNKPSDFAELCRMISNILK